jgi:hypothetical protein
MKTFFTCISDANGRIILNFFRGSFGTSATNVDPSTGLRLKWKGHYVTNAAPSRPFPASVSAIFTSWTLQILGKNFIISDATNL